MAILIKHVKEEAPAPSSRTEIDVPALLDEVVLDCLAKDPDRRPQTALDLKRRLEECSQVTGNWDAKRAEDWWVAHAPEHVLPGSTA